MLDDQSRLRLVESRRRGYGPGAIGEADAAVPDPAEERRVAGIDAREDVVSVLRREVAYFPPAIEAAAREGRKAGGDLEIAAVGAQDLGAAELPDDRRANEGEADRPEAQ